MLFLGVGGAKFVFIAKIAKNGGGQNIWADLVITKFSVNLKKKKKNHRANLVYFSLSSLLISKKSHYLETAAREMGVWVGMLDSLRWGTFV